MSYIGAHASIAGSIIKGIKYVVEELNGTAVQIFLGSGHMASMKSKPKLTDEEKEEIKQYVEDTDIYLVVHACYLLNYCKFPASSSKIQYAITNLIYDVNMAKEIGASGVVVHTGFKLDLDEDEAYKNFADGVKKVIDETPNGAKILLETPAGQGSQIGTDMEGFAKLYNMFTGKYKKRMGICVDTCHIFSAGFDIHTVSGIKKYLKDFNKTFGKTNLELFHINDSKKPFNSRKDQHQGIGHGYIYNEEMGGDIDALEELTKYAKKNKIPMVLETHGAASASTQEKNEGSFKEEIILLNKFAGNKLKNKKTNNTKIDLFKSSTTNTTNVKKTSKKTAKKTGSK